MVGCEPARVRSLAGIVAAVVAALTLLITALTVSTPNMAYAGEASAAMDGAELDWGEFAVESPGLVPMGLSNDVQVEPGSDGSEDESPTDIDDASLDTGETFVEPNMGGTGDDSDIDPQYYSGDVWLSNGQWHTFTFTLSENLLIKLNISQWSNFTWGDVYDCELTDASGHLYAGWPIKYNQYNKKYGYIALPRGTYHLKVHAIGHSNRTRRISLSYDTLRMSNLNASSIEREFNDERADANCLVDANLYGSLYNPWYEYNGKKLDIDFYAIQINAPSTIYVSLTGYQEQKEYIESEYIGVAVFDAKDNVVHKNNDSKQETLKYQTVYLDQDSVSGDARSVCGFDTGVLPAGTYYLMVGSDSTLTFGDAYGLYVEVTPASAPASFKDVPAGTWYQPWVKYASSNGLMTGLKDDLGGYSGYFDPDAQLTRAQVATVLWRAAGSPSQGSSKFPDTVKGSWYDEAVAWCVSAGVVTGYTSGPDKGCFRPDRAVTREELATMVWRFAKTQGIDVSNPDPTKFNATVDHASVSSFAVEPLKWTAAAGIMGGVDYGNGQFGLEPQGTATRAQAAKVFSVLVRDILSGKVQVPTVGKCTITFNTNGGSAVKSQTVKPGGKVTKPASPTKTGHMFKGWYSDKGCKTAFNFNTQVKSNITLYAKWEANKVKVTFDANGGSTVAAQQVGYGSKAKTPPAPTRRGYDFEGWYSDKGLTKAYDFKTAVKSNITLYAKWQRQEAYAILYSDGLLCFQYGNEPDKSHGTVVKSWTGFEGKTPADAPVSWSPESTVRPWTLYGADRRAVKSVVVRDRISVAYGYDYFDGLENCTSMDVNKFDVSKATDLSSMFNGCSSVTTLNVSSWDVSKAEKLNSMFFGCSSLESLDVSGWDVSSGADFRSMFYRCSSLESLDVSGWDVSGGADFRSMFYSCSSLMSIDVSAWDISNATDISSMFEDCKLLTSLILPKCDAGKSGMDRDIFKGCAGLTSLGFSGWNVKDIDSALRSLPDKGSLVQLDVSKADTSGATDVSWLFYGCSSLESLDVANWDVSKVEDFSYMFGGCSSLTALDLSGWDMSSAKEMRSMFSGCTSLEGLEIAQWNTPCVQNFNSMFGNCKALTSLDLSGWDTSSAEDCTWMFKGCASLQSLDVSGWTMRSWVKSDYMFKDCSSLCSVTVGPGFGSLRSALPKGPWYDAAGKKYSSFPYKVAGTFTKYPPAASGDEELDDASAVPTTPEIPAVTEGELDGLTYLTVPEGAVDAAGEAYALDREYAELGGRCVGAGVYVTAYRGEATDLALPAQIGGVDVVSADLSWKGDAQAGISDPEGRTRLESLSLERGCGLASLDASGSDVAGIELAGDEALGGLPALRFLDLSGTRVPSLDPTSMPALERLALRGCPLGADSLASLTTWSGATGLPADLEGAGAKDEPSEPEQPGEPANPDQPAEPEQPSKPANPDQPAEPEQPSNPAEPAVPGEPEQSAEPATPDQPSEPSEPAVPGESEQPAEPVGPADSSESVTSGDPAIPAELSESVNPGHISVLLTDVARIEESAA